MALFTQYYPLRNETIEEVAYKWTRGFKAYDETVHAWYHPLAVAPYREYVWTRTHARLTPDEWDQLRESIRHGFKADHPLHLTVDKQGYVLLGEGNHRLAVALELQLPKVPVQFHFYDDLHQRGRKFDPRKVDPRKLHLPTPPPTLVVEHKPAPKPTPEPEQEVHLAPRVPSGKTTMEELMDLLGIHGTVGPRQLCLDGVVYRQRHAPTVTAQTQLLQQLCHQRLRRQGCPDAATQAQQLTNFYRRRPALLDSALQYELRHRGK